MIPIRAKGRSKCTHLSEDAVRGTAAAAAHHARCVRLGHRLHTLEGRFQRDVDRAGDACGSRRWQHLAQFVV
jgi:hypothetical protein